MSAQHLSGLLADLKNLADDDANPTTPFVAFGTRNAIVSIGPAKDHYPSSSEVLDEDCLEELRDLALVFLDHEGSTLNHLLPHSPYAPKYRLFKDENTKTFSAADVFYFGTEQTRKVIDKLNQWGMDILKLFPPDAPDEQLAFGMTYSHVERREDGSIGRLERRRQPPNEIERRHSGPLELCTESSLFQASQYASHQSDGLPPDLTLKYEAIREVDVVDDGAEWITNVFYSESISRRYDTWGTFPPGHYYFFHLAAKNLAFAAQNAVELLCENCPSDAASNASSDGTSSESDGIPSGDACDRNWPIGDTEHPPDWRTAAVDVDVPTWDGEEGKVVEYGDTLERDRFLFWKWQCGRFRWKEIIEAAVAKGYVLWKDESKAFEDGKIVVESVRTQARRFAKKYADAIGCKLLKAKP